MSVKPEKAHHVPFLASLDLLVSLSFGASALDMGLGLLVDANPVDGDDV
jgi:hypothetical protein